MTEMVSEAVRVSSKSETRRLTSVFGGSLQLSAVLCLVKSAASVDTYSENGFFIAISPLIFTPEGLD